jgi:predicted metal-dependent peptidase
VLPRLRATIPRVTVLLDTSGSMLNGALQIAVNEVGHILKAIGAEVDFVACDHAVHAHSRVSTMSEVKKLMRGGGGSSFVPALEEIAKGKHPDVLIALTDGDITVPQRDLLPKSHTIWLVVPAGYGKPHAPTTAYGEAILVED